MFLGNVHGFKLFKLAPAGNMTKSIESAVKRGEIERFVAEIDGDIPEAS